MAMANTPIAIEDIPSDQDFESWWASSRKPDAPGVVFLYRSQKSDPKRQTAEPELQEFAADCAGNPTPIDFVAINTRSVAGVFERLGIQGGTPKLVFVRNRIGAGGHSQGLQVVGTTLLTPDLKSFKIWIEERLDQP